MFEYPLLSKKIQYLPDGPIINNDWINSELGLIGVKDKPGILTATVISEFYEYNKNNDSYLYNISIPVTSFITINFDYIVNLTLPSNNIELTNKVKNVHAVTDLTDNLNNIILPTNNIDSYLISGFDSSNPDLIFINSPWTANQDTVLDFIPGLIIQKNEESKNYGSITSEIYAVNKYKLHKDSNYNYAQLSNLCEIIINYNFCDYNVTLNSLPSSETSPNPVINISGYVGAEYNNLEELKLGIACNYEITNNISNKAFLPELELNKSELNLSVDDNKLKRLYYSIYK
jgi:hypothetical protein